MALAPVGCLVFLALYIIAASQDPEYTFMDDYLSDLGVGPGAWAFNSGVMIAGALLVLSSVLGLLPILPASPVSRTGGALLATSGVFLMNVGIFTEDAGEVHLVISYAFFLTVLASFGVLSAAMYKERSLGNLTFLATLGLFGGGLAMVLLLGANPFTETVAVMMIMAWGLVVPCAQILRRTRAGPATSGGGS